MKDDSLFYISANYLTEDIPRLKTEIFEEVKKLSTTQIPEDEIQKAVDFLNQNNVEVEKE